MPCGVAYCVKNKLCNSLIYRYLCVFVLVNENTCENLVDICENLVDICENW